ncbi:MAG: apolipoprotein N-acyltransferase [Deltaproteobacteria bacterium]|nr:apolipoprotein N-acyltransferase [Deltaproteobacteria bacterium]
MTELVAAKSTGGLLLPLAAGVTSAFLLIVAPHVYGATAFLICAPLAGAFARTYRVRQWLAFGAAFGIAVAVAGYVPWLATLLSRYFGLGMAGSLALALVLALTIAGGGGATLGLMLAAATRVRPVWRTLTVAAAWTLWEATLQALPPYYPWISLPATQPAGVPWLILVRFAGAGALTFAVVAASCLLTTGLRGQLTRGAAAFLIATIAAASASAPAQRADRGDGCTVAAVDAGVSLTAHNLGSSLERYEMLSEAAVEPAPDVLIWPESALPGPLNIDATLQDRLRRRVQAWGVGLIAGGRRLQWDGQWRARYYNSAYLVDTAGTLSGYDKQRLVPLAEYWPWLPVERPAWLATEEVQPGDGAMIFAAGRCRLGALICFEGDQADLARSVARQGAQALLVLTNDAQLPPQAVEHEIAQLRLRALETGLPVVRVANSGPSLVLDPYGRTTILSLKAVMTAHLPPALSAAAVYLAQPFLYTVAAIHVATWLAVLVARRSTRRAASR